MVQTHFLVLSISPVIACRRRLDFQCRQTVFVIFDCARLCRIVLLLNCWQSDMQHV